MKSKTTIASDTWLTPQSFYDKLNARFTFIDFDPCPPNCDLSVFNGLDITWPFGNIFVNPPYNQKDKKAFINKALHHYAETRGTSVLLLPVSTSTKVFHDVILANYKCCKVEFVQGRLPFEGIDRDGNWCNPNAGRSTAASDEWRALHTHPLQSKINRAGQTDSMLVIFG